MDWGSLLDIQFDAGFVAAVFSIILIDLILAGDNAVVIAMAVRNLPAEQRRKGILLGAGAAVALRVVATFFVAQLLTVSFVKLIGGAVILWIGVKLFVDSMPDEHQHRPAATIWQAIRLIVVADITLSIDNMLAVGGVSHGNLLLLLFGLVVSIPFVVFTSNILSTLMDRYPVIVAIGAAILGKVGAEMMITDPFVHGLLPVTRSVEYAVEIAGAVLVLVVGRLLMRRQARREAAVPAAAPRPATTAAPENS